MSVIIRPFSVQDTDALYRIALLTGDSGADASMLYEDGRMIGHIYAVPYALLQPELALVAERERQVVGYCVATDDSRAFERLLEEQWWPDLRMRYAMPDRAREADWSPDERRAAHFHAPFHLPDDVVSHFPAHLHMNLLPVAQGSGIGRTMCAQMLDKLRQRGVKAAHVGVSLSNRGGRAFWAKCGFVQIKSDNRDAFWMGQNL